MALRRRQRHLVAGHRRRRHPVGRGAGRRPVERRRGLPRLRRGRPVRRQLLRRRGVPVGGRRPDLGTRVRRLLPGRVVRGHRGRPARRGPPLPRHAARPGRCPPHHCAALHSVRRVGVHRRRRHLGAAQGHHRRVPGGHRPRDGPARAEHPVGLVLGRQDLPLHQRRPVLVERDGKPAQGRLRGRRHQVLPRHRARPPPQAGDLCRLRLLRAERHLPPVVAVAQRQGRAVLEAPADRRACDGPGQHPRLLRHAVLLRQRRGSPIPRTPTSSTSAGPTATTSRRSPAASTAARPVARTGRASGTTSTPTSTRWRSSPTAPGTW